MATSAVDMPRRMIGPDKPIRVGVIGASTERGWAGMAHIPALRALGAYEVKAVCTTNMTSAEAVAKAFDIPLAFDDPAALAEHPDVDLITVTVKAPAHYTVLTKILDAGKPVLCEWPVGCDARETAALVDAARKAGVRTFTGLQSRHIPAFCYMRDLIAQGAIGELLSLDLVSTAGTWGAAVLPGDAYALDPASGATILSIWGGHTLDFVWDTFGDFEDVCARVTTQRRTVAILGANDSMPLAVPDNVMVSARLLNGAVASIRLRGGPLPGTAFLLEVIGSEGVISVSGEGGFAMIADDLKLSLARAGETALRPIEIPSRYFCLPRGSISPMALNVAQMYAAIANDLRTGSAVAAGFDDVLECRARLDQIQCAAESGARIKPSAG